MPRQLEQTPRSCCNKAFGGFPRASGSASGSFYRPADLSARTVLHSCIKGFSTGQKTLGESAEGGEGKALTELRLQPTF